MSRSSAAPPIDDLVQEAVDAALERKALDLRVLRLAEVTDFTDYFLIASASSERQVQAIGDAVIERLRACGTRPLHVEQGWWTLLDYGDFVVHVFTEERRRYYGLERLWSDAPEVGAEFAAGTAR